MGRPSLFIPQERHGRLVGIAKTFPGKALYRCDCGTEKELHVGHVRSGKTQSCGCLHREVISAMMTMRQTTHGMFGTPIYAVWNGMVRRCTNPTNHAWKNYGGRGITVCKHWLKFENFYADMGSRPLGMTLERKNNEKGYSKSNCVWATAKTQQNNKRTCVKLTVRGKTQNVTQWAEELGVNRMTVYDRLERGWAAEAALFTPVGNTGPKRGPWGSNDCTVGVK